MLRTLLFFLLIPSGLLAQPGGQRPDGREMPAICSVSGRVVDEQSGEPMEFVSVSLTAVRDSSKVYGGVTDRRGYFNVGEMLPGRYAAAFNFMGYETSTVEDIALNPREQLAADLGVVNLKLAVAELATAEIVEDRQFMEVKLDRKVFNVDDNITTTGGSAVEILENIPSVEIDIDGNISLRGSTNLTVLIDGKPSGLTGSSRQAILDQIPANTIDRIEVITNPSARYDPDGMAGIINVVLKKNKLEGFYGNVKLTAATGDLYDGALGLNWRNARVNVFGSYSFRYNDRFSNGTTDRTTFNAELPPAVLDQDNDGNREELSHTGKVGFDFYLTPSQTLTASVLYSTRTRSEFDSTHFDIQDPGEQQSSIYDRIGLEDDPQQNFDYNLGYRRTFGSTDHVFSAEAFLSRFEAHEVNGFQESWLELDGLPADTVVAAEENRNDDYTDLWTIQTDYERPLPHDGKFETGLKATIRDMDQDFFAGFDSDADGQFENDTSRTNRFLYREEVYAAYVTAGRKFGAIGVQLGGRLEQAFTTSELVTTETTFENDYLSFFPSANVSYEFLEKNTVLLSYSRRINRPRTRQLNPFPQYTDPLNLRQGNPFLLPEYTHSVELGWSKRIERNSVTVTGYYRDVSNVIRRFLEVDSTGVSTVSFQNIAGTTTQGIEFILVVQPLKWWNANVSANLYRQVSDGSNLSSDLNPNATGFRLRGMSTWKWGNGWNAQLSGFWRAPQQTLQGDFSGFFNIDAAMSKEILKQKGSVSLRLSDVFNTREFSWSANGNDFSQEGFRKRESQNLYLSFSYRFGKLEDRSKRRGNRSSGGFDDVGM